MPSNTSYEVIDPKLADAIARWSDFSTQSAQQSMVLFNAITPFKDAAQVASEIMASLRVSDWQPGVATLPKASALSQAINELIDIQTAAMNKYCEGYSALLETAQESGKQWAGLDQAGDSPQALMAAYLDTSLNILERYQADASKEAADLNAIQAAYKAWYQKTMQSLTQG